MNHCVLFLSLCQMVSGAAIVNALKNAKLEQRSKYDSEHDFQFIVWYWSKVEVDKSRAFK